MTHKLLVCRRYAGVHFDPVKFVQEVVTQSIYISLRIHEQVTQFARNFTLGQPSIVRTG